jgi:hypothetical protein
MGLPSVQLYHSYKTFKVIMIGKHLRRMLRAFEVVAKLLKAFYDSEQLAIVRFIYTLRRV